MGGCGSRALRGVRCASGPGRAALHVACTAAPVRANCWLQCGGGASMRIRRAAAAPLRAGLCVRLRLGLPAEECPPGTAEPPRRGAPRSHPPTVCLVSPSPGADVTGASSVPVPVQRRAQHRCRCGQRRAQHRCRCGQRRAQPQVRRDSILLECGCRAIHRRTHHAPHRVPPCVPAG
jgi:hypothetical protein